MKQKADAESGPNDFILKPHYNAPLDLMEVRRSDLRDRATLIIREPRE